MADEKIPKPGGTDGNEEWREVTSGYERGDGHKEGPYATVSKGGAVECGVEATALAEEIARERGLARHQWVLALRAGEKKGQVGCIPIPAEQATRATATVRWYEKTGSPRAAWHIGGVFKDYPTLRPKGTVKCLVSRATAPDGQPMLVLPVKAGISTQTATRDDGTPGSQAAATEE